MTKQDFALLKSGDMFYVIQDCHIPLTGSYCGLDKGVYVSLGAGELFYPGLERSEFNPVFSDNRFYYVSETSHTNRSYWVAREINDAFRLSSWEIDTICDLYGDKIEQL